MSIWAEVGTDGPAGRRATATRVDGPMGALPGWWIAQHPGGWTGWGDDAVSICSTSIIRTVPSLVHVCRFLCIVVVHEMVRFCDLDSPQYATAKIGEAEQVQLSRVFISTPLLYKLRLAQEAPTGHSCSDCKSAT